MVIHNVHIYHKGTFIQGSLTFHSTIEHIHAECDQKPHPCDDSLLYLVPGFIDIHTHGGAGLDVNHLHTHDEVDRLSHYYASHGTTSFQLSLMSDSVENTERVLHLLSSSMECGVGGSNFIGIHLEGPFLSQAYKGAMNEKYIRKADEKLLQHYQERAHHHITYMTVAPENEGIDTLIRHNKESLVFSMGHSGATYEQSMEAIACGVNSATHMFNAMKLFHMHAPAICGAALESDIYTEAICDGFHLCPAAVRLLIKTKGLNRVIAITDSMMAAGLGDGLYTLGSQSVVVKDHGAQLLNGVRAGSTLTQERALHNIMEFTSFPLEKVLPLLTMNPARLLHLEKRKGSIAEGKDADFVLLNKKWT